jgi:phosphatidylserine/phosphatidylglycerophosphate/cardiolipin synthase-like enzyme
VAREDAMGCLTIRIATAYLNPTADFLDLLARCASVTWFLTAGPVSHGFAPKQQQQQQLSERERSHNVEDRSHGWTIPNVFRHAARRAVKQLGRLQLQQQKNQKESSSLATKKVAQVAFYQRPGWTFHAKGLWLSSDHNDKEDRNTVHGASLSTKGRDDWSGTGSGHDGSPSTLLTMPSSSRLIAVCTGSGNFGARSTSRDMESNLVLIFTSSSNRNPLARYHVDEWNHLCEYANTEELPTLLQSPRWIPFVFPFVRSFF